MANEKNNQKHSTQVLDSSELLGFEQISSAYEDRNSASAKDNDDRLRATGRILSKKGSGEVY